MSRRRRSRPVRSYTQELLDGLDRNAPLVPIDRGGQEPADWIRTWCADIERLDAKWKRGER